MALSVEALLASGRLERIAPDLSSASLRLAKADIVAAVRADLDI